MNTNTQLTKLPQLDGTVFLSEAGMETDLLFNQGIELPEFAAFPLLDTDEGRTTLTNYFQSVVDIARRDGTGVVLETPTWRANPDWGNKLGYTTQQLDRVNRDAVALFAELRAANPDVAFVISGNIGPRGDGYAVADAMTALDAARYHQPQIQSFANAGADLVSAFTINYADEAIGIIRSATNLGVPVVISFTLETDGNLPTGQSLADAIDEVDAATDRSAAYFMVNCAHPSHFAHIFDTPGPWDRIRGVRANASRMSHDELDNATELDRGNEAELAAGYSELAEQLPQLAVVGGCCGTDIAHLDHISSALSVKRIRP